MCRSHIQYLACCWNTDIQHLSFNTATITQGSWEHNARSLRTHHGEETTTIGPLSGNTSHFPSTRTTASSDGFPSFCRVEHWGNGISFSCIKLAKWAFGVRLVETTRTLAQIGPCRRGETRDETETSRPDQVRSRRQIMLFAMTLHHLFFHSSLPLSSSTTFLVTTSFANCNCPAALCCVSQGDLSRR